MAGVQMRIEPFNGSNFQNWKYRVEGQLSEQDCKICLEPSFKEVLSKGNDEKAVKKDNRAKNIIIQCLHDNQLTIVREKETAYDMWQALNDTYEKKGLCGKMLLKKKLLGLRMTQNETIDNYILRFESVLNELKSVDTEMTEEDKICTLLMGVDKKYNTVVSIIESMDLEVTYEFVKRRLKNEDEKNVNVKNDIQNIPAPVSFNATRSRHITCHYCGKNGHMQRDCWHKKNQLGQRSQPGQRNQSGYRNQPRKWNNFGKPGNLGRNHENSFNNNVRSFRGNYNFHSEKPKVNDSDNEPDQSICFMQTKSDPNQNQTRNELNEVKFFIDSGCTDHIVNSKEIFNNYIPLKNNINIQVAKNTETMNAVGIGTIFATLELNGVHTKCELRNVLYVPNSRKNLLSVKRMEIAGMSVLFTNGEAKIMKNQKVIGAGKRDNLYEIVFHLPQVESMLCTQELWHSRYGHISNGGLKQLVNQSIVDGIEKFEIDESKFCESCTKGKMTRLPFSHRRTAKEKLEIVHTDVCGPISPMSTQGHRYFVTFLDDYTHFLTVYLIKSKGEVLDCFKEYLFMNKNKFNKTIHKLRCDNGGEYTSNEFKLFCKNNGVVLDYTVPYTPEQNSKSERMNRTLVEKVRSMIDESGVSKNLWSEAVYAAAYILNRSPTCALKDKTPAEAWFEEKPNVKNLKRFGCTIYYHVPKELRQKLDDKCRKGIFVGYAPNGYRVFDIETGVVKVVRDIKFNESDFYYKHCSETVTRVDSDQENVSGDDIDQNDEVQLERKSESEENQIPIENQSDHLNKRQRNLPKRFEDYELYMAYNACIDVPIDFDEVESRHDKVFWQQAIQSELDSIVENDTWEVVDKPYDKQILDTKWVFALKDNNKTHKARLVVRGFQQNEDTFDYDKVYAPVARMPTIRTLLAVGVERNYFFEQLDIKTAFLNGDLTDEVFIFPPKGVKIGNNKVLKLKKSLYGLKQASNCWNNKINNILKNLGFKRSENDSCLYSKVENGSEIYLLIFVDDIIIGSSCFALIQSTVQALSSNFKLINRSRTCSFMFMYL
ncbi:hypothetical protein M8J77_015823 [Diaphorina citri]|nr:hypothetical protein M8J77_015823 [Diaphorina citri]